MALSKKPVNGMKDILPAEMEIRDYVTSVIKDTYRSFGFTPIETPCMENIANLTSKQGGENEKLIFKVMKRGEKLNLETAKEESDVVDFGMRYDLTVPLSRYYSNNANNLPSPFKALQMGSVWRADRPQRGRYRQFTQCDIDILGEPSNLAEIELITATTTTIGRLGFENFEIRINERRILKAMAAYSGFAEEDYDSVFITLDKMDKIGVEGVASELAQDGYPQENIDKYLDLFKLLEQTRALYNDRRTIPAVHPRYANAYHYLYGKSQEDINEDTKGGTFGIRLFLCALMFAAFLTMDKQKQEVFHMSSSDIANEITKDTDIQEIWKSL